MIRLHRGSNISHRTSTNESIHRTRYGFPHISTRADTCRYVWSNSDAHVLVAEGGWGASIVLTNEVSAEGLLRWGAVGDWWKQCLLTGFGIWIQSAFMLNPVKSDSSAGPAKSIQSVRDDVYE